MTGVATTTREC